VEEAEPVMEARWWRRLSVEDAESVMEACRWRRPLVEDAEPVMEARRWRRPNGWRSRSNRVRVGEGLRW
jgi:hypothetical protein